jgi:hypothetical protein
MIAVCGDPADPATALVRVGLATAPGRTTPELELRRGGDGGLRCVDAAGREALVAALAGWG